MGKGALDWIASGVEYQHLWDRRVAFHLNRMKKVLGCETGKVATPAGVSVWAARRWTHYMEPYAEQLVYKYRYMNDAYSTVGHAQGGEFKWMRPV